MQVFAPPSSVRIPSFDEAFVNGRYSMERDDEVTNAFLAELKATLIAMGYDKPMTGEVVRFPIADGYAQYMVAEGKTTVLIHLPIHDAWSIPAAHARGLRKADIKALVSRPSVFGRRA